MEVVVAAAVVAVVAVELFASMCADKFVNRFGTAPETSSNARFRSARAESGALEEDVVVVIGCVVEDDVADELLLLLVSGGEVVTKSKKPSIIASSISLVNAAIFASISGSFL